MPKRGIKKFLAIAAAILSVFQAINAWAAVSGACDNCHTIHNSQGGSPSGELPYAQLLLDDCVGCHSSQEGSIWKDPVTGAPIVYNAAAPEYGGSTGDGKFQGLAGGNFYWAEQDSSYGHNIFISDSQLSQAPGGGGGCGADSCHADLSIHECRSCHMIPDNFRPTMGWHHADDSATVIDKGSQGWYRFLAGHQGETYGVSGIEDPNWEYAPTSTEHNEYLGQEGDRRGGGGFQENGNTTTGFCTGCHGDFHVQNETSSGDGAWLKHPSDQALPGAGEYAGYSSYDPLIPVARTALSEVSGSVTAGSDMVMCLSCHRAHASPYPDMLRFDYSSMQVGGGGADGKGCFKCHSGKDGV